MSSENGPAGAPLRVPLDLSTLGKDLIQPGSFWRDITVVDSTGSTNTDLAAQAAEAAPEGTILAAEEQLQGRGRMGRRWVSPPRAALMVSVLLRPAEVPPARRGWVPLLAGVAAATAVRKITGVPATLKWPNDLLVGDRKLAGILAEQSGDAIVAGLGINVSTTRDELPDTGPGAAAATSLLLEGATSLDRTVLLIALLEDFAYWYQAWRGSNSPGVNSPGVNPPGASSPGASSPGASSPGDPDVSGLRRAYLDLSATIGQPVRVERPAGRVTTGRATGLNVDGHLIVEGPGGLEAVSAGDVRHLR